VTAPRTALFDAHHERYESWFGQHQAAYYSELLAIRALLPWQGLGLEIGVGTGRFAGPLGIGVGIDPSAPMLVYALRRGVAVVQAVAEALPFKDAVFDYALIVTTICFVDDARAMLAETRRALRSKGRLVIGFIDRASALGQHYVEHQAENVFYREATFYSASEVELLLQNEGFQQQTWIQTLSKPLSETVEIEPVKPGCGNGAFVVVRATKSCK
jgi:SAM-dependent methyltransferase